VNIITIVRHDSEDPIEFIMKSLADGGVESMCFPGVHERESERQRERKSPLDDIFVHRF
jgi:hypothetical protein